MTTYTVQDPEFTEELPITEPTDLAHADNINAGPKRNFENMMALKLISLGATTDYDETAAYAAGTYCINGGKLYKNKTAIASGGEEWTAAHWEETDVLSEVKGIIDDLGLGGGGGSGSGVSLSGGEVSITDDGGNKVELKSNGQLVHTPSSGSAVTVSLADIKAAIDWINNTGKGIPATVTAAQNKANEAANAASAAQTKANSAATAASNAQSTATTANNTANTVNNWKNTYDTLMKKLAGQA